MDDEAGLEFVRGDATGVRFPAHGEALRRAGAAFLTEAFQAYGALPAGVRVERIVRCAPFGGGNSGHKLLLDVEYSRLEPGLPAALFVKFSRDFADPFRDRRRHELQSEVRLYALSRLPAFPVAVPRPLFADFHAESGTGVLITERIAFGQGGVEPLRPKCMDHLLADPLAHYRALVAAQARLVAAYKSGRLSPEAERLFPVDLAAAAAENPIALDEAGVRERVAGWAAFAARCRQLLPANLADPGFFARMEADAVRFLRHEAEVRRFLHADPAFISLAHWNTHIDNAWFWRDGAGELQCGLLDWGLVRPMNVATALWGGLSGASLETWDRDLDELLGLFVRVLRENGGPALDRDELRLHLDLSVALLGLSMMLDTPALVSSRLPEAARASGPLDPVLLKDSVVHGFLHVSTAFLNLWETHDFGASLDRMLARAGR